MARFYGRRNWNKTTGYLGERPGYWMLLRVQNGTTFVSTSGIKTQDRDAYAGTFHPDYKAEVVPQTDAAWDEYAARHGVRKSHARLAEVPKPAGD